ncbi:hypothetical protein H7I87_08075 [Mycobacterium timonense]|uniref:Uncharacterized protein n=2 Tax=Mycobacterium TaxID=1763 RepID=A0AAW5SC98_MYCBC|nr:MULTISPECIES: hypothetical protein [Mycobacterium]MCV6993026.1 hypothetical protein [Mycobacterium bouchedurhonense]MCV6994685.1 hypothetical protein [Mycobacterium timonense]ORA44960.1 hypothetical protein BST19_20740 [Mycobacterium bouchedurhonense]CQD23285.1 hypothetical protein BN000_05795 [Mycobacterium europaeum]
MTDIQVLLNNIRAVVLGCASTLLMLWAFYYFFRQLFGQGGRDPVKIVVALVAIAGAAGGFALIPALLSAGDSTGKQIGGGGGYSMPAPAALLPSTTDAITVMSVA